eukprot:scaffold6.g2666.t1
MQSKAPPWRHVPASKLSEKPSLSPHPALPPDSAMFLTTALTPPSLKLERAVACARRAYVTLLTKDAYLPGVQALARSLETMGATYPLVVLHTAGVGGDALGALRAEGCQLRAAEPFHPPGVDHSQYKRELYLECWSKLRMWQMEEYERLVYLDADMVLCKNIDHLFDLPPGFYAGGRETAEERASCCHFRPHETPAYFNAGCYVMSPSHAEFDGMMQALAERRISVHYFAEQDFLNGYFAGRWMPLPYVYNAQKRIKYHHPDLWVFSDICVIHYVDEKPWSHRHSEENLAYKEECDWWWDVFTGKAAAPQTPLIASSRGASRAASLERALSRTPPPARAASLSPAASLERALSRTPPPLRGVSLSPATSLERALSRVPVERTASASLERALSQLSLGRAASRAGTPIERAGSLSASLPIPTVS